MDSDGMNDWEFFTWVKDLFRFLQYEYRFAIVSEEILYSGVRRSVVFQNSDLCIEIGDDYSDVYVEFSLCSQPKLKRVFAFGRLLRIMYTEDGEKGTEWSLGPEVEESLSNRAKIIAKLNWYAKSLRVYIARILVMYNKGDLEGGDEETYRSFKNADFFELVKHEFIFLLDEYNFTVIANKVIRGHITREVVFQRNDCCIRVGHDESQALVYFAPSWYQPEKGEFGFDIGHLVTFLNPENGEGIKEWRFDPNVGGIPGHRAKIVFQLEWYAETLKQHINRILPLFEREAFLQKEPAFLEWEKLWQKKLREGLREYLQRK